MGGLRVGLNEAGRVMHDVFSSYSTFVDRVPLLDLV